jgi:hypothetical protein
MQHAAALETAMVFLICAACAWWGGASIAYMLAGWFSISSAQCSVRSALDSMVKLAVRGC